MDKPTCVTCRFTWNGISINGDIENVKELCNGEIVKLSGDGSCTIQASCVEKIIGYIIIKLKDRKEIHNFNNFGVGVGGSLKIFKEWEDHLEEELIIAEAAIVGIHFNKGIAKIKFVCVDSNGKYPFKNNLEN